MIKKSIKTLTITAVVTASMGGAVFAKGSKLQLANKHQLGTVSTRARFEETCINFDKKYLACLDLMVH